MKLGRWQEISPSQFAWEREALAYVREALPDHEPYRAWSNFEFIADDGTINEVDLLVLGPAGFFLVEIKSRPGELNADTHTWTWRHDGRYHSDDNPLFGANRKAKKLASLLKRQKAMEKLRLPFVDAFVFCSAQGTALHVNEALRSHVFGKDHGDPKTGGIVEALTRRRAQHATQTIDAPMARAVGRALEQAGIKPANRVRKVSDYILERILFEHPSGLYQDWLAGHATLADTHRMVRLYPVSPGTPAAQREIAQRAAEREFRLLQPLEHESVLQVENFTNHELGPALIFRLGQSAVRLDHFMRERGASLTFEVRLGLLRQIAEAVAFAHGRRVVHRRLSPHSVFVVDPSAAHLRVKLYNWQLAGRLHSTSGSSLVSATLHAEQLAEDATAIYLPPEVHTDPDADGEAQDIFALGAIAYFLFTGQAPAASALETTEKVIRERGLDLGAVLDGARKPLCELIKYSTLPAVHDRYSRVREFLKQLDAVEDEYTQPEGDKFVPPLDAKPNDLIAAGIKLKSRLGSGSTAVALLVSWRDRDAVLKVASKPDNSDRVRSEFNVLQHLQHPRIVKAHELMTFGPLVGVLLDSAGPKTLAQQLRDDGPLSLDFLERFGTDLLDAVCHLEEVGFPHRDIKPENIGVRATGKDKREHLVLFDFSLSSVPADNVRSGTTDYLDPFLASRKRWDSAAERYSAALTLYQMATGDLPKWGDGQSHPAALECEITIEAERFDAGVRDSLNAFFGQALRRDFRQRFDNAHDMLEAWRAAFRATGAKAADQVQLPTEERAKLIAEAKEDTPLFSLGISNRAANALDRASLVNVRDFLLFPIFRLNRLRGVGKKTVRELTDLHAELRPHFPNLKASSRSRSTDTGSDAESTEPEVTTLELVAMQILAGGAKGEGPTGRDTLRTVLALPTDRVPNPPFWPSQVEVGKLLGVSRQRVGQAVAGGRERWRRNVSLTAVRQIMVELIAAQGGVMTVQELAQALLTARGSGLDEPERTRTALAVARAAVEAESSLQEPRIVESRDHGRIVIAQSYELADYAFALGAEADALAVLDPLATPQRALEKLRAIKPPSDAAVVADNRLLQISVANSHGAALSTRLEVYPRGMEPRRVLQLAQGIFFGAGDLTVEELQRRVRARYPEAAPLPPQPALDSLLEEVGSRLKWNAAAANNRGAYQLPSASPIDGSTGSTTFSASRSSVVVPTDDMASPEMQTAREFDVRLAHAHEKGAFLVLMVELRHARAAELALKKRFPLVPHDGDELLVSALQAEAAAKGARWETVMRADGAPPDSRDWGRLQHLVTGAVTRAVATLVDPDRTVLLTNPGLLARYDRLEVLDQLRDEIGRSGSRLHGLWVLVPCDEQHALPTLHRRPIRVTSGAQWARVPEAWLKLPQSTAA